MYRPYISQVTCKLGSTIEMAEILAVSLGITDEIVGLKTTALLIDDEASMSKYHGDCVIPFSSLASGQLSQLLKRCSEEIDGIPSFNLVTSNFDSYVESYQANSVKSEDETCKGEESSQGSVQEGALYSEAFLELMEKSDEFDAFEKNCLLRFGIDNVEQGSVLYRASFRVA